MPDAGPNAAPPGDGVDGQNDSAALEHSVRAALDAARRPLLDLSTSNSLLNYHFADHLRGQIQLVGDTLDAIHARLLSGKPHRLTGLEDRDGAEVEDERSEGFALAFEGALLDDDLYFSEIDELDGGDPENPAFLIAERTLRDRIRLQLDLPRRPETEPLASRAAQARLQGLPDAYELPRPSLDPTDPLEANEAPASDSLQTLLLPHERTRKHEELLNLQRVGLDEHGASPLYAAYGLLKWHGAAGTSHVAPLLLHPVTVAPPRNPIRGPLEIQGAPAGICPNPALREVLRAFDVRLPVWEEDEGPEDYLQRVKQSTENRAGWRVYRTCMIAAFDLVSIRQWADLDPAYWPDAYQSAAATILVDTPTEDADAEPEITPDAQTILETARDKGIAVVETPPGTGKTDLIADLVLEAWERGESVLVVSSKNAALQKLAHALGPASGGADFSPFLLDLREPHSRDSVIRGTIRERLSLPRDHDILPNSELPRAELNTVATTLEALDAPFGATGFRPDEIRIAERKVRKIPLDSVFDTVDLERADQLDAEGRERCRIALSDLEKAWSEIMIAGSPNNEPSPWAQLEQPISDESYNAVQPTLERWHSALGAFKSLSDEVAAHVGWPAPVQIDDVVMMLGALPEPRILRTLQGDAALAAILPVLADPEIESGARRIHGLWKQLDAIDQDLRQAFDEADQLTERSEELAVLVKAWHHSCPAAKELTEIENALPGLQQEADTVIQARSFIADLGGMIGVPAPDSPDDIALIQDAAALIARTPPICLEADHAALLGDDGRSKITHLTQEIQTLRNRYQSLMRQIRVTTKIDPRILNRVAHDLEHTHALARPFSARYGKAKRLRNRLLRPSTKHKDAPMLLRTLAELTETLHRFQEREIPRSLLGPIFDGITTQMSDVSAAMTYARNAAKFANHGTFGAALAEALCNAPAATLLRFADRVNNSDTTRVKTIKDRLQTDEETSLADLETKFRTRRDSHDNILTLARRLGLPPTIALAQLDDATARLRQREALVTGELPVLAPTTEVLEAAGFDRPNVTRRQSALGLLETLAPPTMPVNAPGPLNVERWRDAFLCPPTTQEFSTLLAQRERLRSLIDAVRAGERELSRQLEQPIASLVSRDAERVISLGDTVRWAERASTTTPARDRAAAEARSKARDIGLDALVDALESTNTYRDLGTVFDKVYWLSLARRLKAHPKLGGPDGPDRQALLARRDGLVAELRAARLAALKVSLLKRAIPAGRVGSSAEDSQEGALLTYGTDEGPRLDVLLSQAPRALKTLMPCWLASPASLAAIATGQDLALDLVILDEAGALSIPQALTAALRARFAVVLGDAFQAAPNYDPLPLLDWTKEFDADGRASPMSTFERCLTIHGAHAALTSISELMDPTLLAFANDQTYDGSLRLKTGQTWPDSGLRLNRTAGFSAGRVNLREAEAIVLAARQQMRTRPDLSLGIALATPAQAFLVETMISRIRASDAAIQSFLDRWAEEPEAFFVKPLDAVQGDRRDVILASLVHTGDDQDRVDPQALGVFSGPDGERHLNTLVTRARLRFELFTGLSADMIEEDGETPRGVLVLKDYLEHMETNGRVYGGRLAVVAAS